MKIHLRVPAADGSIERSEYKKAGPDLPFLEITNSELSLTTNPVGVPNVPAGQTGACRNTYYEMSRPLASESTTPVASSATENSPPSRIASPQALERRGSWSTPVPDRERDSSLCTALPPELATQKTGPATRFRLIPHKKLYSLWSYIVLLLARLKPVCYMPTDPRRGLSYALKTRTMAMRRPQFHSQPLAALIALYKPLSNEQSVPAACRYRHTPVRIRE